MIQIKVVSEKIGDSRPYCKYQILRGMSLNQWPVSYIYTVPIYGRESYHNGSAAKIKFNGYHTKSIYYISDQQLEW